MVTKRRMSEIKKRRLMNLTEAKTSFRRFMRVVGKENQGMVCNIRAREADLALRDQCAKYQVLMRYAWPKVVESQTQPLTTKRRRGSQVEGQAVEARPCGGINTERGHQAPHPMASPDRVTIARTAQARPTPGREVQRGLAPGAAGYLA